MKVQNPIIGRARGSAGGMTFCKNYDKNVARAKAFEVSNPKTQAQQTQRAFFAELTALCSDFSDDQLRSLFPSKPKTMSRRNAISKQIAESYAIDGTEKTIDYSDIDTLGNAPVGTNLEATVTISAAAISISWDESNFENTPDADYYALFALVNETKKTITLLPSNAALSEGELALDGDYDNIKNDAAHVIMFKGNLKKDGKIALVGFGTLAVTKRPARK